MGVEVVAPCLDLQDVLMSPSVDLGLGIEYLEVLGVIGRRSFGVGIGIDPLSEFVSPLRGFLSRNDVADDESSSSLELLQLIGGERVELRIVDDRNIGWSLARNVRSNSSELGKDLTPSLSGSRFKVGVKSCNVVLELNEGLGRHPQARYDLVQDVRGLGCDI